MKNKKFLAILILLLIFSIPKNNFAAGDPTPWYKKFINLVNYSVSEYNRGRIDLPSVFWFIKNLSDSIEIIDNIYINQIIDPRSSYKIKFSTSISYSIPWEKISYIEVVLWNFDRMGPDVGCYNNIPLNFKVNEEMWKNGEIEIYNFIEGRYCRLDQEENPPRSIPPLKQRNYLLVKIYHHSENILPHTIFLISNPFKFSQNTSYYLRIRLNNVPQTFPTQTLTVNVLCDAYTTTTTFNISNSTENITINLPNQCQNPTAILSLPHFLTKRINLISTDSNNPQIISLINGDTDGNNKIDDADLLNILFKFGNESSWQNNPRVDLNFDNTVNEQDQNIVLENFGMEGDR
jgi:hypothetical protein